MFKPFMTFWQWLFVPYEPPKLPNMERLMLPTKYRYLYDDGMPRMIREAVSLYGTKEVAGKYNDNPVIVGWAQEVAQKTGPWIAEFYKRDSIPWCGLFVGVVAKRAGKPVRADMLGARNWLKWGTKRRGHPKLGDVLVFWRGNPNGSSGHVGLYVGEDATHFHVLGGNQGDEVNIMRLDKKRLLGAVNHYAYRAPDSVKRIMLDASGRVSENEA